MKTLDVSLASSPLYGVLRLVYGLRETSAPLGLPSIGLEEKKRLWWGRVSLPPADLAEALRALFAGSSVF